MAAPSVLKSRDACLKKLIVQEKSARKVTKKNILCPEFQEWPRPSEETADLVLTKLSEVLENHPNIFKYVRNVSESDQEGKKKIRSQLEIGVSAVFRALEKDRLSCVLVSGQAKPAAIVDHVISLARERGCPILCLDSLSTTLAVATKTKVYPLCIGFKILDSDTESDFAEIVSLIHKNTKVTRPPYTNKRMSKESARPEELPSKLLSESLRPLSVQAEKENEIMTELKHIMSKALVQVIAERKSAGKNRKKKKNQGNVKELFKKSLHCHFDVGKRTVMTVLERGKLQLILLSTNIVPFLMTESPALSLLQKAKQMGCPVICVPLLTPTLKAACGANVSVMGFKKFSSLPSGTATVFQSIVEKCLYLLRDVSPSIQKQESTTTESIDETASASSTVKPGKEMLPTKPEHNDSKGNGVIAEASSRKEEKEDEEEEEEEEEEDYSYLHIRKENSAQYTESTSQLKKEIEEFSKDSTLTGNFISFGSDSKAKAKTTEETIQKPKLGKRKKSCEDVDEGEAKKFHGDQANVGSNTTAKSSVAHSDTKVEENASDSNTRKDTKPMPLLSKQHPQSVSSGFISLSVTPQQTDCAGDKSDKDSASKEKAENNHGKTLEEVRETDDIDSSKVARVKEKSGEMQSNILTSLPNESESKASSSPPLFTISRKGDRPHKDTSRQGVGNIKLAKSTQSDLKRGDILGGDLLPTGKKTSTEMEAEHIRHTFDATRTQGKSKKRKQESSEGLISLAYTEANIHTMVSDVSKKRKKKKKRSNAVFVFVLFIFIRRYKRNSNKAIGQYRYN